MLWRYLQMARTMPAALVSANEHKLCMDTCTTAELFPSRRFLKLRAQLRDSGKGREQTLQLLVVGKEAANASQFCPRNLRGQ